MKNAQWLLMTLVTCLLLMSTACTSTRRRQNFRVTGNVELLRRAGSKMRRSVCMSKEQWAAYDEEQGEKQDDGSVAEFFREQMNRGSTGATTVELN